MFASLSAATCAYECTAVVLQMSEDYLMRPALEVFAELHGEQEMKARRCGTLEASVTDAVTRRPMQMPPIKPLRGAALR